MSNDSKDVRLPGERVECRSGWRTSPKRRVLIVGGGLAGMSAAEALMRNHADRLDVTILEGKRVTGGRAGSFCDPSTEETIDYCQHVAMGCCTNLLALLQRCGLQDCLQRYSQLMFYHPGDVPSRFGPGQWLPPPLHLWGALRSLKHLNARQKRSILRAMFKLMRTTSDSLRDKTAAQWLGEQGQDDDTMTGFWDVVLVSALAERSDVVAMSMARKVLIDGFAAARGAADVMVPNRRLADLFGCELRLAIENLGAKVQLGAMVGSVSESSTGAAEVNMVGGQCLLADHLVLAVPWHSVERTISPLDRLTIASLKDVTASPITGIHLWFDREITDLPHAVMVGTVAQWLFRQPYPSPTQAGCYYQVVISGTGQHQTISRTQLVNRVVEEIKVAFPLARQANLVHHRTVTDPQAVFSISPWLESIRPPARTALPWFHLAGDWIATGWPATMEGAVVSGRMAADSLLESERLSSVGWDPGLPRGWLARCLIKR